MSLKVDSAACTTCSSCGNEACSSGFEYGIGTSAPVTRITGASSQSNACSWISAARFAPTPPWGQPSSTIDRAIRLLHRFDDRVEVERPQRARIDHLRVDLVLGGERLGRLLGGDGHSRDAHDGHIVPSRRMAASPKRAGPPFSGTSPFWP